jgi:hypothetical protein
VGIAIALAIVLVQVNFWSYTNHLIIIHHSRYSGSRVLRYRCWGEPCACILCYREERRRKARDIYRRYQPLQPWPCIRPVTSCISVTARFSVQSL